VSSGPEGREAFKGKFEATLAIYALTPDFCSQPLAWERLQDQGGTHFSLCKYYDFVDGLPESVSFCEKLAQLHSSYTSPNGKFGFQCTTYNDNLP
jgi:hypothetical protein